MSVAYQTHRDLEIILVDDGSTDGSEKLCDELSKRDERIRVFHKENGGSSSARNLGLENATGEYIGFVDSDDYIEPDMYELLLDAIVRTGADMSQISRDEVNEDGTKRQDVCIPPAHEWLITSVEMLRELLMHRGDASFCTRLTKKTLFENRRFPQGELNEDFKLLTDMLKEVKEFPILPKQCYHVFYRVGSNTRKKNKNEFSRVFADCVNNADRMTVLCEESYPELKKEALRFNMFQRLDYLLHIPIGQMTKDNVFYKNVVRYFRQKLWKAVINPYLSVKNKIYIVLFAMAPRTIRVVHAKLKGFE